jgi:hypothetical protein
MADTDIDAVKKRNNVESKKKTYDMYMSSLRHIHDPVLSSLKIKGISFFFILGGREVGGLLVIILQF